MHRFVVCCGEMGLRRLVRSLRGCASFAFIGITPLKHLVADVRPLTSHFSVTVRSHVGWVVLEGCETFRTRVHRDAKGKESRAIATLSFIGTTLLRTETSQG